MPALLSPETNPGQNFNISQLSIPAELGRVEKINVGSNRNVILIKDVHEVPEAQSNIEKVIERLAENQKIDFVGLEGAWGTLDPLVFRSYPDQEQLRKVFESYLSRSEVTGGVLSSVFTKFQNLKFVGLENQDWYEQGIKSYLEGIARASEISNYLSVEESKIRRQKKEKYSSELFELDQKIEEFNSKHENLEQLLVYLSRIKKPDKDSLLENLLENIQEINFSPDLKREIASLEILIDKTIRDREDYKEYQFQKQENRSGNLSNRSYAAALNNLAKRSQINFEPSLAFQAECLKDQKMKTMDPENLWKEFEAYSLEIENSLLATPDQYQIAKQSKTLNLIKKLSRFELSPEDFRKILQLEQGALPRFFDNHLEFYRLAVKRDEAFVKHLIEQFDRERQTGVFIGGGFHAENVAVLLNEQGIGTVQVHPFFSEMPNSSQYQAHMNGNVSWNSYWDVRDGKVCLYDAFVRAIRNELISDAQNPQLILKCWRDQVIRNLAVEEKLKSISEYTRFIDEVVQKQKEKLFHDRMVRLEKFIGGLKALQKAKNLNLASATQLLNSHTSIPVSVGPMLAVPQMMSSVVLRSEVRQKDKEEDLAHSLKTFLNAASFAIALIKRDIPENEFAEISTDLKTLEELIGQYANDFENRDSIDLNPKIESISDYFSENKWKNKIARWRELFEDEKGKRVIANYKEQLEPLAKDIRDIIQKIEFPALILPSDNDAQSISILGDDLKKMFSNKIVINNELPDFLIKNSFQIKDVLVNLIQNALTAGSEDLQVIVNFRKEASNSQMFAVDVQNYILEPKSVISRSKLNKMFNRGFTEGTVGGTGIGLATVKKTVLDLGGEIYVETISLKGRRKLFLDVRKNEISKSAIKLSDLPYTKFTIVLPLPSQPSRNQRSEVRTGNSGSDSKVTSDYELTFLDQGVEFDFAEQIPTDVDISYSMKLKEGFERGAEQIAASVDREPQENSHTVKSFVKPREDDKGILKIGFEAEGVAIPLDVVIKYSPNGYVYDIKGIPEVAAFFNWDSKTLLCSVLFFLQKQGVQWVHLSNSSGQFSDILEQWREAGRFTLMKENNTSIRNRSYRIVTSRGVGLLIDLNPATLALSLPRGKKEVKKDSTAPQNRLVHLMNLAVRYFQIVQMIFKNIFWARNYFPESSEELSRQMEEAWKKSEGNPTGWLPEENQILAREEKLSGWQKWLGFKRLNVSFTGDESVKLMIEYIGPHLQRLYSEGNIKESLKIQSSYEAFASILLWLQKRGFREATLEILMLTKGDKKYYNPFFSKLLDFLQDENLLQDSNLPISRQSRIFHGGDGKFYIYLNLDPEVFKMPPSVSFRSETRHESKPVLPKLNSARSEVRENNRLTFAEAQTMSGFLNAFLGNQNPHSYLPGLLMLANQIGWDGLLELLKERILANLKQPGIIIKDFSGEAAQERQLGSAV